VTRNGSVRAVVFDFDGTVANTFPIICDAFREVFKKYSGISPTDAEIVAMFGPTETSTIRDKFPEFDDIDPLVEDFFTRYESRHDQLVEPVPTIDRYLASLAKRGFKLGIFTGKSRRGLAISCARLFKHCHFDALITGDDVAYPKPNPEGLLKAMAILGVGPSECLYVGDSDSDMLAGRTAGVTVIRAAWFDLGALQPERVSGDYRFTSFEDFMAFMDGVKVAAHAAKANA
jgi:pyrophosphatase PpaX